MFAHNSFTIHSKFCAAGSLKRTAVRQSMSIWIESRFCSRAANPDGRVQRVDAGAYLYLIVARSRPKSMVKQFTGRLRDILMQFAWLYSSYGSTGFVVRVNSPDFARVIFYRSSDIQRVSRRAFYDATSCDDAWRLPRTS